MALAESIDIFEELVARNTSEWILKDCIQLAAVLAFDIVDVTGFGLFFMLEAGLTIIVAATGRVSSIHLDTETKSTEIGDEKSGTTMGQARIYRSPPVCNPTMTLRLIPPYLTLLRYSRVRASGSTRDVTSLPTKGRGQRPSQLEG
jgi:hypothetical protein